MQKQTLQTGQFPGAKIVVNSLTADQIGAGAIGSSELSTGAVDTNALSDLSVTQAKLAFDSVGYGPNN